MEKTNVNTALVLAFSCLLAISALSMSSLLTQSAAAAKGDSSACPSGFEKSKGGECSKPATAEEQPCPGLGTAGVRQFFVDGAYVCTKLVGSVDLTEGGECPKVDNAVVVLSSGPSPCLIYEITGTPPIDYSCQEGTLKGTDCVIKRGNG
jgi:hypothetical protein